MALMDRVAHRLKLRDLHLLSAVVQLRSSRTPSVCSSSLIAFDTAGCVRLRWAAAFAMGAVRPPRWRAKVRGMIACSIFPPSRILLPLIPESTVVASFSWMEIPVFKKKGRIDRLVIAFMTQSCPRMSASDGPTE